MRAAVIERYGPPEVVQIMDVPRPVPAEGEVLVQAFATTVNSGDARVRVLRVPRGVRPLMRLRLERDAVALCFGGSTALNFFRLGNLAAGETLLVNGASGAVGIMAVQLAKHLEAEVTAVCSAANAELVKGLGGDHVVDYAAEDFARNGRRYDVIMDNHGNVPYSRAKGSLQPGGRLLMVIGDLWQMIAASWQKPVIGGSPAVTVDNYRTLISLAEGAS